MLQNASAVSFDTDFAGLVVDEWVEVIPSGRATAALTFHYDTPGSRPGNAVLMASPPQQVSGSIGVSAVDLPAALSSGARHARSLAQMRMVDLAALDVVPQQELSVYLPATLHTFVSTLNPNGEPERRGPRTRSARRSAAT